VEKITNMCVCVCVSTTENWNFIYGVLHILVQNHKVLFHSELNGYITKEQKLYLITDTASLIAVKQQFNE
jgi:hypothetical protein